MESIVEQSVTDLELEREYERIQAEAELTRSVERDQVTAYLRHEGDAA